MDVNEVKKSGDNTNGAKSGTEAETAEESKTTESEVEKIDEVEVIMEQNPHKEADEAKEKSKQVLSELKKILQDNPDFCTDLRRNELLDDIKEVADSSTPRTVFGVLGNTGV